MFTSTFVHLAANESLLNQQSVSVATLAGTAQKAQQSVHNRTSMNQDMMKGTPETVTMMPPPPHMSHEQVQSQSAYSTYVNKVWEVSDLPFPTIIFIL